VLNPTALWREFEARDEHGRQIARYDPSG